MERYATYRDQIRRMPAESFPKAKVPPQDAESAKEAAQVSFVSEENGSKNNGPYSLYLRRRKRLFAIKVILFVVAIAAFVVWWFLLQGRSK